MLDVDDLRGTPFCVADVTGQRDVEMSAGVVDGMQLHHVQNKLLKSCITKRCVQIRTFLSLLSREYEISKASPTVSKLLGAYTDASR